MIKKTNDKSMKEVMEQMLQVYKLRRRFDETSLIAAWPELMGTAIANRTKEIFIKDKKLFLIAHHQEPMNKFTGRWRNHR